jgi:hypothetical protein
MEQHADGRGSIPEEKEESTEELTQQMNSLQALRSRLWITKNSPYSTRVSATI